MLQRIAHNQGLTVAAIIHSPSQAAYETFDDLLVLGPNGCPVYFGERSEAMNYFSSIGFLPSDASKTSEPDFIM